MYDNIVESALQKLYSLEFYLLEFKDKLET